MDEAFVHLLLRSSVLVAFTSEPLASKFVVAVVGRLAASGAHAAAMLPANHPANILAVFFGANTYIGNGPNFMVKAIADHQKIHTPTFLGYIVKFTLPFMLPMLVAVWLLFFRY
jgi:Na+/H+ antiporter NhaD/arsenite permease-like protein